MPQCTVSGTWRNAFLAGAKELREGAFGTPISVGADLFGALTVTQVFDSIAVRIDGPRAWDTKLTLSWVFTDLEETYVTELRNGALNHRRVPAPSPGSTTFTLTRLGLIGLIIGTLDLATALSDGTVSVEGEAAKLGSLVSLIAPVDPAFAIVTP